MSVRTQDTVDISRGHLTGWAASVCLHLTLLLGAAYLLQHVTLAPQEKPFEWDVAMVRPPDQQSASPPAPQPALSRPSPISATPPTRPTDPTPASQSMTQQYVPTPVMPPLPESHPPIPQQRTSPIPAEAPPRPDVVKPPTPPSTAQTEIPSTTPVQSTPAHLAPPHSNPMPIPTPTESKPEPVQDTPPAQPQVPAKAETPRQHQAAPEPAITRVTPTPEPPTAVHSTPPTQESTIRADIPKEATAPSQTETAPTPTDVAAVTQPVPSNPSKPDDGWLSALMAKWLDDLKKHYPAAARQEGVQGKVVLVAVLHEDGTLTDVRIAKSSGNALLDQAAIADVEQGPPIKLSRPLGRPQRIIKLPISYDLKTGR